MRKSLAIAAMGIEKSALAGRRNAIALLAWPVLAAAQYPSVASGLMASAQPASGCEAKVADEGSRIRCAMENLRQIDSRLNAEYGDLKFKLKGGEVSGLTETQRTWIRTRDQSCQLARNISDRDAWLAAKGVRVI